MPRQEFGPFSFEAPPEWLRSASLVFVGEGEDAEAPPDIVVARDPRSPKEALTTHAWRQVCELAKGLPAFELLGSRQSTVDGQPAFKALVRWSSDRGPVTQGLAWIDSRDGGTLKVTCSALDVTDAFDDFERLLASVRLGARASMVVPAGPPERAPSASTPPPPPIEDAPISYPSVPMPGARSARR